MAQRFQEAPTVRPVASPVNTYARPDIQAPAQSTGLTQLAEALSDAEPALNKFIAHKHEEMKESDIKKARQARLKNQSTFADAVKLYNKTGGEQGVAPGQSPWFVKEYKRMDGQLAAREQYMSYINEKYQTSGLAGQVYNTPAESARVYAEFVGEARNEFLSQHANAEDMDWFEGFESEMGSIESSLSSTNMRERAEANEERFNENVGSFIMSVMDSDASMEHKAQIIFEDKERKIGQFGMSGSDYNKQVIDAVSARAVGLATQKRFAEAQRELDLLAKVKTGTGTLGNTAYAREKENQARQQLFSMQRQIEDYNYTWQERRAKEAREEAVYNATKQLLDDPQANINPLLEEMARDKDLSQAIPDVKRLRDSISSLEYEPPEDPEFVTYLRHDIMVGTAGPKDIQDAIMADHIGSSTAASLLGEWDEKNRSDKEALEMPRQHREVMKDMEDGISKMLSSTGASSDFLNPDEERNKVMATALAKRAMIEWSMKNPEASVLDVMDKSQEILEKIVNNPKFSAQGLNGAKTYQNPYTESEETGVVVPDDNPFEIEDAKAQGGNP